MDFNNILRKVGKWPMENCLDFGGDTDYFQNHIVCFFLFFWNTNKVDFKSLL